MNSYPTIQNKPSLVANASQFVFYDGIPYYLDHNRPVAPALSCGIGQDEVQVSAVAAVAAVDSESVGCAH